MIKTLKSIKAQVIMKIFPYFNWIPVEIRPLIQEIFFWPLDFFNWLKGERFFFPPRRVMYNIMHASKREILENSERDLSKLIKVTNMELDWEVLDVGCGFGRMALPMLKYLNKNGRYDGIDIVPIGINWCKRNITPKYPNFNFKTADIYNKLYNRTGKYKSSEYKFPYENNSFNLVCLLSVFPHMRPEEVDNYLSEIFRVLKNNGKCFAALFLLNEETLQLTKPDFKFVYDFGQFRSVSKNNPETIIAHPQKDIYKLYTKHNLQINQVYYGTWRGPRQKNPIDWHQDVIIASKL